MSEQHTPICMAEEYWSTTYFSVARYYGGMQMNRHTYKIVNKEGATIFELSDPDSKYYVGDGEKQTIPPGQPADLVREDFIPFYKKLGRDAFIKVLEENQRMSDTELKKIYKEMTKIKTLNRKRNEQQSKLRLLEAPGSAGKINGNQW